MIIPSDNLLKDLFSFYLVLIVITTITMVLFSTIPASAEMNLLDDNELSKITATGFSKFTLIHDANDLARVELNEPREVTRAHARFDALFVVKPLAQEV